MTTRRRGVLAVCGVIWAVISAIGVGAVYRYSSPADDWTRLIEAGDALVTGRAASPATPPGLSARAAYLLAFHHAQDARDVPRMLAAADRLDRLADREAAEYARQAANSLAAASDH